MALPRVLQDWRKTAGAALIAATAAMPLTSSFAHANDAEVDANPGVTASAAAVSAREYTSYDKMNGLEEYATATGGMGVFINMQHNMTPEQGANIGDKLVAALNRVELDGRYELNQSRGTTTDFTLYVGEVSYTINASEMKTEFPKIIQRLKESRSLKLAQYSEPDNSR